MKQNHTDNSGCYVLPTIQLHSQITNSLFPNITAHKQWGENHKVFSN